MENIAVLFEKLLEKYPLNQWRVRRNIYEDHVLDISNPNVDIKVNIWYHSIWNGFNPKLFGFGGIKGVKVDNCFIESSALIGSLFLPIVVKYLSDEKENYISEVKRDTRYISDRISKFIESKL